MLECNQSILYNGVVCGITVYWSACGILHSVNKTTEITAITVINLLIDVSEQTCAQNYWLYYLIIDSFIVLIVILKQQTYVVQIGF